MSGKAPAPKDDGGKVTIKILLVDDIAETREGIKKLLAFEQDFKVVGSAGNGREGVELAKELKPDIVIMDINMPDMDGLEAASRITKAVPTIGVIMMSVQDDPDYMQKAMLAGARFFLTKPVTMDQLYNTIRSVYQQYEPIRRQMAIFNQPGYQPIMEDSASSSGGRPGNVIVVYSPQGGAGCTTIATNLASGLMKEGIKVLLIDADLEFGDVGAFLDLRSQSTLSDAVENAADLDVDYFDSIVVTHSSGLKVLLGPQRPSIGADIREGQPDAVNSIIQQVKGYYDFVVVDTSTSIDAVIAGLLETATKILLVTTPTLPSIKNTRLVLDMFVESGFPNNKTALVLNRAIENPARHQRGIPTPDKIQSYLKRPLEGVIPLVDETIILNAINKGVPVIAYDRDQTKAPTKQYMKLADHLFNAMMGVEETDTAEPNETQKKWSLFGNR